MCLIPAAYPPAWARYRSELSGTVSLEVAGFSTHVQLTPERLEQVYLPVLGLLVDRSERLRAEGAGAGPQRRLVAGLAGIGAGGKSTFAAVLAYVAARVLKEPQLVVVGMDGWHFPNCVLDARWTTDSAGRPIRLRRRKGGPDSYDISALAATLRELRVGGRAVSVPVYDRRVHDPVPDGLTVPADTRIVLMEGNYLLCDCPPWDEVSSLMDVTLFLECDLAEARRRMIGRHVRGGISEAEAVRKYEENDGLNAVLIAGTAGRADHIVRL